MRRTKRLLEAIVETFHESDRVVYGTQSSQRPSSVTRRTGRSDCNRDARAGLDAGNLTNTVNRKSVWAALNADQVGNLKSTFTDSKGRQFQSDSREVSGIEATAHLNGGLFHATEISPTNSVSATVMFFSRAGSMASPGLCQVQLEFLVADDFSGNFAAARVHNFAVKIEAN